MDLGDLMKMTFFIESENKRVINRGKAKNLNSLGNSLLLETIRVEERGGSSTATILYLAWRKVGTMIHEVSFILHVE